MRRESEKEWYFGNADKERRGPFSFEQVWSINKAWYIIIKNFATVLVHKGICDLVQQKGVSLCWSTQGKLSEVMVSVMCKHRIT